MNSPGLIRRLLVLCYDGLLLLAVLFIASALTLPFNSGEAWQANNLVMTVYLLLVIFLFYGWFWTHGGQTLGMRAWKIHLEPLQGESISWKQSAIRFLLGLPAWSLLLLGSLVDLLPEKNYPQWLPQHAATTWVMIIIGLAWLWLDQRENCWRDRLSQSHLVLRK